MQFARRCKARLRRGSVIVLFAAGLVAFVGMTALVIDVGMVYYYTSVTDRVVNATALCAARVAAAPGEDADRARTAALAVARSNGLDTFTTADVQVDPKGNNPYIVRITPQIRIRTFFAASMGFDSFELPYEVYAMGGGTGAVLLDKKAFEVSDAAEKMPSGYFPSFLFHGSLKDMVMLNDNPDQRTRDSEAALASKICQSGQYFSPGDRVWLNGGTQTQAALRRWIRRNRANLVNSQYLGGCDLPYPGIPTIDSRYTSFNRSSCLQKMEVGQVIDAIRDRTGWVRNAQEDGVNLRVAADPGHNWSDCENGSARLVIVPICRAHINMGSDTSAGTDCPNFATLPYIYPEIGGMGNPADQMRLLIIGQAKVWIEGIRNVNTPRGRSNDVIEATFIGYVDTPPDGQYAG